MENSFVVLSEQDYLDIIELIHKLQECETQPDLGQVIQSDLFPLFQVQAFGSAWSDFDLKHNTSKSIVPILTVGFTPDDMKLGPMIHPYFTEFHRLFAGGLRTVLACDIDVPRETLQKELNQFFTDHPDYDRNHYPVMGNIKSLLSIADSPDYSIGIGLSRIKPYDKPFTHRELRMAELLQPSLVHAIKYIALRRDLTSFSALAEHLADTPTPIALVRPEGGVLFCNPAFEKKFNLQLGDPLPDDLAHMVQEQDDVFSPSENFVGQDRLPLFYRWDNEVYRLNLTRLDPMEDYEGRCWLLKFKPALEPQSQVAYAMHRAQLTARETEVASLVCDGFTDKQVADRLFISPNTVNNHLKHIFNKMEVHNRVQLANRLQGIMKGKATE